jgi:hypothetical protein
MDGALPPIPAQTPPQHPGGGFPSPTGPSPAQRSGGLVGRPSNDEAQQEARVVRTQELRRLEAVLPKQATDSKIQITRISGGDGRRISNRPVMTILISDLEEAVSGSGITSEEYITEQLRAKFNEGKFKCQVFDRAGKVVPGVQAFVLSLDEDDDGREDDGEEDEGEDGGYEDDPRGVPTFAPPPPPATFGGADYANQSRREREEERGRSNELLAIMMNAQQSNQQMMTMFMQQAQQQQAAQAEAARQAAEAAAARSSDMWKVLITAIAPIVGSMLQPKESTAEKLLLAQMSAPKGMTPEMQVLLDIVKGKGDSAPQMMAEMLKLQNTAASSAIETQAKLTASVIDSTLSRMKELQSDRGGNEGGGTLESIAKIAGPVIAAMMARGQGQQAEAFDPAQQQVEQPPALPAPAPEAPAPAPRRQRTPPPPAPEAPAAAAPPAPAPAPAVPAAPPAAPVVEDTEDRRIQSCLLTVAQMSTGKVPPPARWDALRWCLNRMPPKMLEAIKASQDDEVLKLGTNAVLTEPRLIEWFTKPASEGFLREAISDMRLLALNQLTPEIAQKAIQKQAQWVAEQTGRISKPAEAPPAEKPVEKPAEAPQAEKPAEQPAAPASDGPEEVVPPPEEKPKGRKRRTPPPAAVEG